MNNYSNFRNYDIKNNNQYNIQLLNDRDMFNKFSNTSEIVDTTSFNLADSYGMPIQGGNTSNNKKSLLSTPFVMETNDKTKWESSVSNWNNNDMYAELESDLQNNFNKKQNSTSDMAYNNISGVIENNGFCKIESDVLEFEYEISKNKQKEIVIDVSSPFALAYVWKILILLTKNPSTDKFVQMLGIKNKDSIISDTKKHAEVFEDSGQINILIPDKTTNQTPLNTNYINKIQEIYKISINENNENNNIQVNLVYNFILEIPFYYQPRIINDNLLGYTKVKTKFFELTDVPIFLMVDKQNNIVCVEIPCASNMTLGFIYSTERGLLQKIPYEFITQTKKPDCIANKLVIPKINRNKKSLYSKNFKDVLSQVHLGEILYGTLFQVDINMNMGLTIGISKEIPSNTYEIKKSYDNITINHKCFYYVKNSNIANKILSTGMINY